MPLEAQISIYDMKVALLGDIALFGRCTKPEYFETISQYLSRFDYVVGNLETPFSAKKRTHGAKSAYICADSSCAGILKELHLNAVTLANNHMFDYGKEGYEVTKNLLKETGIEWFGTEGKELRIEIDGNKIAFSGYCCYSLNPLQCVAAGDYGVNAYSIATVRNRLKANKADGYFNIVAVHAGTEHVNYPSLDHIRAARLLAEDCPYVYYGHHPHVIQGVEEYHDSLIAHSLGNFCFDDVYADATASIPLVELTENNRTGMIQELTIENNKVVESKEQIIYIPKDGCITLVGEGELLNTYNEKLKHSEENSREYEAERLQIINGRLAERKAQRNIRWFLKRLRPRYMRLMFDMRKNKKLYNENVKKYI